MRADHSLGIEEAKVTAVSEMQGARCRMIHTHKHTHQITSLKHIHPQSNIHNMQQRMWFVTKKWKADWSTLIYHGPHWSAMLHSGIPWSALVYHDPHWSTMVPIAKKTTSVTNEGSVQSKIKSKMEEKETEVNSGRCLL